MNWNVYLSGEIHSDWRQQIADGVRAAKLPITLHGPVTDHDASDGAGDVLGSEDVPFCGTARAPASTPFGPGVSWSGPTSSSFASARNTGNGTPPLMPGMQWPKANR